MISGGDREAECFSDKCKGIGASFLACISRPPAIGNKSAVPQTRENVSRGESIVLSANHFIKGGSRSDNRSMKPKRAAGLAFLFAALSSGAFSEEALRVSVAAREKIVERAIHYIGKPYRYGGTEPTGFDCSGLVYLVYRESTGARSPRTVDGLWRWMEAIPKSELQAGDLVFFRNEGVVDHVGIYIGDWSFVHAVSDRQYPVVIKSSFNEPYWAARFAGAGRVLPASGGWEIRTPFECAILLGEAFVPRGVEFRFGVCASFAGKEIGLRLGAEYDGMLGVFRAPLMLSLSPDGNFRVFAGPALCIGKPEFRGEGGAGREYEPSGGLLGVAGISWKPASIGIGGREVGAFGEIVYEGYRDLSGFPQDWRLDARARIRIGFGLEIR
jgi:hypothetical protein